VHTIVSKVVVPLQDANHWNVVVMNNENLIRYDPSSCANLFQSTILHQFLAKVWAAMQAKLTSIEEWKRIATNNNWHWIHGPQ